MKTVAAIVFLMLFAAAAMAQINFAPMVPQSFPPVAVPMEPMVPGHGPMVPNTQTGSTPPPTCSNSLDFSDACNSQYLGMMRF